MSSIPEEIIVINDKILIKPEDTKKTGGGILIPDGIQQDESILNGYVAKVGRGYPLGASFADEEKPWMKDPQSVMVDYMPLQVMLGDFVFFIERAAMEFTHNSIKWMVIPEGAILAVIRKKPDPDAMVFGKHGDGGIDEAI